MNLELERLIARAEQKAREEERSLGPCGKHPRACWVPTPKWSAPDDPNYIQGYCTACAREARAVEEEAKKWAHIVGVSMDEVNSVEARVRRELQVIVDQQAEDEGLWFMARTAPEAYLQQELRRLHDAIERGDRSVEGERGE